MPFYKSASIVNVRGGKFSDHNIAYPQEYRGPLKRLAAKLRLQTISPTSQWMTDRLAGTHDSVSGDSFLLTYSLPNRKNSPVSCYTPQSRLSNLNSSPILSIHNCLDKQSRGGAISSVERLIIRNPPDQLGCVPQGTSDSGDPGRNRETSTDDDCGGFSLEWDMLRGDSEDQPDGGCEMRDSELLEKLSGVLQNKEQRDELCHMQGRNAQVMIEYLYTLLSRPEPLGPGFRRHCLVALCKLCKASKLYPQCYTLNDQIVSNDSCTLFGHFSDIHKGIFKAKEICLKMVRLDKPSMAVMLKCYAKEAILWGQLNHPNIAPFYGIYYRDQMRDQLCLVSPWMNHGHVVQYLQRNPSVSRPPLAYDVVAGLAYLHDSRLIHSDLKGTNILVNALGQACITDLGMSFIHSSKTLVRSLATSTKHGFTQRWASPELLEPNAQPSMESDIWALGCVFYEILTGNIPFYHMENDGQVITALIKCQSPVQYNPRKQSLNFDPKSKEAEVWKQAKKCWATSPKKRPQSKIILQQLESAGISRQSDLEKQREAEWEVPRLRHAMRMETDDRVDADDVRLILNCLLTVPTPTILPTPDASFAYR